MAVGRRRRFVEVRRGYDKDQVDEYVARIEREREELRRRLAVEQRRLVDLEVSATPPASAGRVALASAVALRANARVAAEEILAAARAREAAASARERDLEHRAAELDRRELGVAAAERPDHAPLSRAAGELAALVDGDGGLGPFSEATAHLVDYARSLLRTNGEVAIRDDATAPFS